MVICLHDDPHLFSLISPTNATYILASLIGGLFPDIDIKSKGQQLLYALIIPLLIASLLAHKIVFSILLATLGIIAPLLPHRGITHELWFVVTAPFVGPILVSLYCPEYTEYAKMLYLFFSIGAISHLILDFGPTELIRRTGKMLFPKAKRTHKK